ncbi:hypothetical protein ACFU93_25240 [Streptomyces sp. NPDC057611]
MICSYTLLFQVSLALLLQAHQPLRMGDAATMALFAVAGRQAR